MAGPITLDFGDGSATTSVASGDTTPHTYSAGAPPYTIKASESGYKDGTANVAADGNFDIVVTAVAP